MPRALITGVTGQDGWYLRELLERKGYEIFGWRRDECDVTDPEQVRVAVQQAQPDEIYHLAAQSHVGESESAAAETMAVNVQGTENLLHSAATEVPQTRFFFASSCQVFGDAKESPQRETSPFNPVNPYGVSKMEATHKVRAAREAGLFAVSGFLYNHESPRRREQFVSKSAAERRPSRQDKRPSCGWAIPPWRGTSAIPVMWCGGCGCRCRQLSRATTFFASGETHTIQEIVEIAFATLNLDWREHVKRDDSLNRKVEPS